MPLSGSEIRDRYLKYFVERGHKQLPSSSLVPRKDPTVLLTTAGMLQFKPFFMGLESPAHSRVTTVQKCFRTTDLDNVGRTARHHTFFEMLGNFSFGDYFKAEVIAWAWEFTTQELGLAIDRLWVTVFTTDDEAADLWHTRAGVARDRIVRLGEDSNFWAAGPTGPCGPCSELHYDLGPERGCGKPTCAVGCDCDRYLEFWNLVFMQFNRDEAGTLTPLPRKNIDTRMGLERICSIVQNVPSNFDTDLLKPALELIARRAGVVYGQDPRTDVSLKLVADHLRGATFLVGDGVIPSNEGRGYVLRRIIRRAVRHGKLLGIKGPFVSEVASWVVDHYGHYPELPQQRDLIVERLATEEQRFGETLDRGMQLFDKAISRHGGKVIPGEVAFELFDTYGFPVELTEELAQERGLSVDLLGFRTLMDQQRDRARKAREEAGVTFVGLELTTTQPTRFVGYQTLTGEATVLERIERAGDGGYAVVLDQTPFYAESGGQVGDQGALSGIRVVDTQKQGDVFLHVLAPGQVPPAVGQTVVAEVDRSRREATVRHHTGTHLLHSALKQVLGDQAAQAGSYVGPDELRFDFTFGRQMSQAELQRVEDLVNAEILASEAVNHETMSMADARAKGAVAMFGEKYGDVVRVIAVPGFSTELCGGTHAHNTGEIGLFKITEEKGISSGVRRIRAVCGLRALEVFRQQWAVLSTLRDELKVSTEEIPERVERLTGQLKEREDAIRLLKAKAAAAQSEGLLAQAAEAGGMKVIASRMPDLDADGVRAAALHLRDKLGSGVVVLASDAEGKLSAISAATPDAVNRGVNAGKLVAAVLDLVGGRGGGKPDLAQGGGGDPAKLDEALAQVRELVNRQVAAKV